MIYDVLIDCVVSVVLIQSLVTCVEELMSFQITHLFHLVNALFLTAESVSPLLTADKVHSINFI